MLRLKPGTRVERPFHIRTLRSCQDFWLKLDSWDPKANTAAARTDPGLRSGQGPNSPAFVPRAAFIRDHGFGRRPEGSRFRRSSTLQTAWPWGDPCKCQTAVRVTPRPPKLSKQPIAKGPNLQIASLAAWSRDRTRKPHCTYGWRRNPVQETTTWLLESRG